MKVVFILSVIILQSFSKEDFSGLFQQFKNDHDKKYESYAEELVRFEAFKANLVKIEEHNSRPGETWKMAVTKFADLTEEEFKASVVGRGYIRTPKQESLSARKSRNYMRQLPDHVDWRDAGVVTDVKNQGSCGSCWAFATTEQIESYAAINNATLEKLSAQEITTCTPNTLNCGGSGGCLGSIPQLGYNYVQLFGLATNEDYPYWSGVTGLAGWCKYDVERRTPHVGITGYNTIPPNDLEATLDHIANVGPLAVAADASRWQLYGHGVFSGCSYEDNISLNHAVQLVGYGSDDELGDYWLVRNSWGNWGEQGYIRLKRETELVCGNDYTPAQGTACQDGPGMTHGQKVCGQCGLLFDSSYPLGAGKWSYPGN